MSIVMNVRDARAALEADERRKRKAAILAAAREAFDRAKYRYSVVSQDGWGYVIDHDTHTLSRVEGNAYRHVDGLCLEAVVRALADVGALNGGDRDLIVNDDPYPGYPQGGPGLNDL